MPFSSRFLRVSWSALDVRWGAALISLALSAWALARDPVINNDGILYLRVAALFDQGDWRGALTLYPWPFYSLLIALVHRVGGLSFEYSAHLLNAAFFAMTVFVFVTLVRDLGGCRRALLVAAATVILLHPQSNEYRSFVIRDTGYWACYLLGVLLLSRYAQQPRLALALGWGSAMAVASLFRIEGMVVLLLLPLALFAMDNVSWTRRLRLYLYANSVLIALLIVVLIWLSLNPARLLAYSGRLFEPYDYLLQFGQSLSGGLREKAAALAQAMLNEYSAHYALAGVVVVLATILVGKIIEVLNLVYAVLSGHALARRLLPVPREVRAILLWLILVNLAIVIVFLVTRSFLQGRFVMPLALILMLAAPFSLIALFDCWQAGRGDGHRASRWPFPAACLALVLVATDALFSFGPSKAYVKQAGVWLKQNTPSEAKLYSDSEIVTYYADKPATNWKRKFSREEALKLIDCEGERGYDYLALTVSRKQPEHASLVTTKLKRAPVARFRNKRGDEVLIFAVQ